MVIIIGLIILIAAVVVGVAGVFTNLGAAHSLTHGFAVLGYHLGGPSGKLFLFGMVVGAVALFGLSLLLTGVRHTSRLGRTARRGLEQSRGETAAVSKDRDELIDQREAARSHPASAPSSAPPSSEHVIGESEIVTTGH